MIHRDIKPENILLQNGRPMVADFGIALAVSAAAGGRMTETGLSLGTPHYMSPEQAVTVLRKSVPPNVAAAVAKALEKLPADRFESASAFARALADPAFRTSASLDAATGVGQVNSGWKQAAAMLGVAALGLGGLAGWALLRTDPRPREVGLLPTAPMQMAGQFRNFAVAHERSGSDGSDNPPRPDRCDLGFPGGEAGNHHARSAVQRYTGVVVRAHKLRGADLPAILVREARILHSGDSRLGWADEARGGRGESVSAA